MPAKGKKKAPPASRFSLPEPMTKDQEKAEEFLGIREPRVGRPRKERTEAEIRIQYKLPLALAAKMNEWGAAQSPPIVDPKKILILLLERALGSVR